MRASLDQHLIAVAAAVNADGGEGVLRVLRDVLRVHAPFDLAEVACAGPSGFQHFTLTDDGQAAPPHEPLAAEDLLLDVSARPEVRRFDDLAALDVFPATRERLAARGLRSLLVLPLSQAGGAKGAVVLARAHAYAFVGASLRVLVPLAAMAGLALDWARALLHAARQAGPEAAADGHTAQSDATILSLGAELDRQHAVIETLRAERDAARRECESLRATAGRHLFGRRGGRR